MLQMDSLSDALAQVAMNRSRLVFLCAKLQNNNELESYQGLDINRRLSERLINMPKKERARNIPTEVGSLINQISENTVLITGLEILFDRSLAVDPIRLLAACAKNKTLIVLWPGDITSFGLSYATPSHPEYRTYKASDLSDAVFLAADAQLH